MAEKSKGKKEKNLKKAKKELLKRAEKPEKKDEPGKEEAETAADSDEQQFDTPEFEQGKVVRQSIVKEMKSNYLDYSMSVIVSRALPDVRDGLKPSQRRILVAMNDLNLKPGSHYRKSAKIAGDTSGNYHPHGEQVVYPTMVKMAQDFSTRYPLVDGQGNFGSIDGDTPAAMRYTEARMGKITSAMIQDLEKGTVTYIPNYDATRTEPTILPTVFPNLLCNGSDGIAVGMATKIPPHNMTEVVTALREMIKKGNKWKGEALYNDLREKKEKKEKTPRVLNSAPEDLLENYVHEDDPDREEKIAEIRKQIRESDEDKVVTLYPKFESGISLDELIEIIPGPDFPTGGTIYNRKEVLKAYETGRGRVLMRAKASIQEGKRNRMRIIVTEVPYQVNKAHMISKIADLAKEKKITGISDIRDESNREGIRVVIKLKKDAQPKVVLNKLYKYTEMQKAFNANMIALVNGEPKTLNLKRMLELFITHRIEITIRRYEFELAQNRYRGHILEGYLKALDLIDEVIKLIRASKTQEEAKDNMIKEFDFTEVQAQAILDMQLRRLAALEKQKIEDEFAEIKDRIKLYTGILGDNSEILKVIDRDLEEVIEKYGDDRRTKVVKGKVDEISEEDIIAEEDTFVTITRAGYVKRVSPDVYKTQKRGGKGKIGATTKEGDYVEHAVLCSTHDVLLLFTNRGRVFDLKTYDIPESGRTAKGLPIVNLIQIEQGEIITSVLKRTNGINTVQNTNEMADDDDGGSVKPDNKKKYLFMATEKGVVKKTDISEFENIRSSGLIAIKLQQGDELGWVQPTTGEDEIMLITRKGKSIRFSEDDVRSQGRNTQGVTGIKFKFEDDEVISMIVVGKDSDKLFVISEKGYGKMTELKQYSNQNRGGSGIYTFQIRKKTGDLVAADLINGDIDEMVVMSKNGVVIRLETKGLPKLNRQTSGVKIMDMKGDDEVTAMVLD
ncbi:DNA gyrase subunit A [Candidatus Dojkabacteria bacterium]|nr:DNA gyrase subunit A [Candidatus Dojkabacteria bacterium]